MDVKRKKQKNLYNNQCISDEREQTVASTARHGFKQRRFFISGKDVLETLDVDMDDNAALEADVIHSDGV